MNFKKIINTTFGILGLLALTYLINKYGLYKLINDIKLMGFKSFLLVLTYIPTLICYALAWICVTHFDPKKKIFSLKNIYIFTKLTAASIAWNNLTPFLKIGGEPLKVLMLKKHIPQNKALISTIIYNIIHILGTLCSFILISLLIPLIFPVENEISIIFWVIAFLSMNIFLFLLILPSFWKKFSIRNSRFNKIKKMVNNLSWSLLKTKQYFYQNKIKVFWAILLETLARFVEGLVFFYAFILLKEPISLITAAFLDAGRTLIDTLLFFIPYQVGAREQGIIFLMNKVFKENSPSILSAVLSYRFVEISWTILGQFFWLTDQYFGHKKE